MLELNPHVVDIFGNTRGRDQLVMKMDRAVDLVSHLDSEILAAPDTIFFDPFSKAGEVLFASALLSAAHSGRANSSDQVAAHLFSENRFFALAPNFRHHQLSLRTFGGLEGLAESFIVDGDYLCENSGKLDKKVFKDQLVRVIQHIEKIGNKQIVVVSSLPCQRKDNSNARVVYNILVDLLVNGMIEQMLVIAPERWFSGAKKLADFREIKSGCVKYIRVKNSRWIFPTFGNREGVCYVYGDAGYEGSHMIVDSGKQRTEVPLPSASFLPRILGSLAGMLRGK